MNAGISSLDEARQQRESEAWRAELAPSGKGYLGDERNILIALRGAPQLLGITRYNEFSLEIELARLPPWRSATDASPWNETDDTQLTAWLQRQDIKVRSRGAVADSVIVVARDHAYHPVRSYLSALQWDGEDRIAQFGTRYLGARGNLQYLSAVCMRFLISAAARIFEPGCQADHVLVLEGPQGIGKTSAARALAVTPQWFAGDLPEIHSKDSRLQLLGRWIIEIAELKAIRSTELEVQKSFITQTHDTFRPPYGRRTAQFPRQCVFIATTNESEYLRDRTGNRRYWPVKCTAIDVPALTRDRDQLWAQAVVLYRGAAAWHLTEAEATLASAEQQERVHVSELEQDVRTYVDALADDEVTVRDVLVYGLRLDPDKPGYAEAARKLGPAVAEALEHCGWQKTGRRGKQRRTTYQRVDKGDNP
jgi:putative DNA primase/helicase